MGGGVGRRSVGGRLRADAPELGLYPSLYYYHVVISGRPLVQMANFHIPYKISIRDKLDFL